MSPVCYLCHPYSVVLDGESLEGLVGHDGDPRQAVSLLAILVSPGVGRVAVS